METKRPNDKLCARNAEELSEGNNNHLHHQKSVMIWAIVACDGSKSLLSFTSVGVKVENKVYAQMLLEKMLPWVIEAIGDSYVFFKDEASGHTSTLTQGWCKEHFNDLSDMTIWPH